MRSESFQSTGERIIVCKDGPNVAQRADNLRPDAKSTVSVLR